MGGNLHRDILDGVESSNDLRDFAEALLGGDFDGFAALAGDKIVSDAIENVLGKLGSTALAIGFSDNARALNLSDDLSRAHTVNASDVRTIAAATFGDAERTFQSLADIVGGLYDSEKITATQRNDLYTSLSQANAAEKIKIEDTLATLAENFPDLLAEIANKIRLGQPVTLGDYYAERVMQDWGERVKASGNDVVWEDTIGALDGNDGGDSFGPDEWDNDGNGWPDYEYNPDTGYNGGFGDPDADQLLDPVIFDLDGDGVEINAGTNVYFDVDDDGFKEATSWAAVDDGFLVLDLNDDGTRGAGDGEIDQAKELIFSLWSAANMTDLQVLAQAYDANGDLLFDTWVDANDNGVRDQDAEGNYIEFGDGILNNADDVWQELRVWQDLDQDGITDQGELFALAGVTASAWYDTNGNGVEDAGERSNLENKDITQINLGYDDGSAFGDSSDDISIFGNTLHGLASYTMGGQVVEGGVGDVSLSASTLGWREVPTETGYDIELESGVTYHYAGLDGTGSANVDLVADWLDGATGDDRNNTLSASNHTRAVQISGGGGNDVITGGQMDDMLSGDGGVDQLRGGGGNDLIFFDEHDSVVEGGSGLDTAIYTGTTGTTFNLQANGFESAYGGEGNDTFLAGYAGYSVALFGGDGNDLLNASYTDDVVSGDGGNDTINARAGDDYVQGGSGNDVLRGETGDDILFGGDGIDDLNGGSGDDMLFGGSGNDVFWGDVGDDILDGGAGDDSLAGASGDDKISGGSGHDTLTGNDGDDRLFGNDGNDRFFDGAGDDYAVGGAGADEFYDGAGDDIFQGGDGNDIFRMYNYSGNNVVQGGAGTDILKLNGHADMWSWEYVETSRQVQTGTTWEGGDGGNEVPVYTTVYDGTGQYLFWSGGTYIQVQDVEQVQFTGSTNETYWSHLDGQTSSEFSMAYVASYNDLIDAIGTDSTNASIHWQNWGASGAGSRHVSFNALQYLAAHSDVYVTYGFDLSKSAEHYIQHGRDEGRTKGEFDAEQYLKNYGDLRNAFGSDLSAATRHYIQAGRNEGRSDNAIAGSMSTTQWESWLDDLAGTASVVNLAHTSATADNSNTFYWASHIVETDPNAVIYGYAGTADSLNGGSGNDTIQADNTGTGYYLNTPHTTAGSNDTVNGGDGADVISTGLGDDTAVGGAGSDFVLGEAGNDVLEGGTGSDVLFGGDGNDTLTGNDGSDVLEGGDGDDQLNGGSGADTLRGGTGVDMLNGHTGSDYLYGGAGNDTLNGEGGSDRLSGDNGDDLLNGGDGGDVLVGGEGADTLGGNNGDDRLAGDAGNDSLFGGAGSDYMLGGTGNDSLEGGLGHDALYGEDGNDTLAGQDDNDILYGGAGNDGLFGGGENDVLNGGTGGDTLDGGDGIDTSSYADATAGVYFRLNNADAANFYGEAAGDVFASVENAYGSGFNDKIYGTGSHNVLWGADGDDTLVGEGGNDDLIGGAGNDTLYGGSGIDRLDGGDGNDLILGGTGADQLIGGEGTDRAQYSSASEMVVADLQYVSYNTGEAAGDTFDSIENLHGSAHDDSLRGDGSGNTIWGWDGNDHLHGRNGNDVLYGGAGNDILWGGSGADILNGGDGVDRAQYSTAAAAVLADLQFEYVNTGEALGDTYDSIENLAGSAYNDNLRGDGSNNIIWGGAGNDQIYGRKGNDSLVGQSGDDYFNFFKEYDQDRVYDFEDNADTLVFKNFDLTDAQDALSHATQSGSDVVFDFGEGDILTVLNTSLAVLSDDILIL